MIDAITHEADDVLPALQRVDDALLICKDKKALSWAITCRGAISRIFMLLRQSARMPFASAACSSMAWAFSVSNSSRNTVVA